MPAPISLALAGLGFCLAALLVYVAVAVRRDLSRDCPACGKTLLQGCACLDELTQP